MAVAVGLLALGRSVPSVAGVRAFLRAAKTGIRCDGPALAAAFLALVATAYLVARGLAPTFAVVALGIFALRTLLLLVVVRPAWRARTLGMIEAGLGLAFVAGLAIAWNA
jgi:hypothetical protein